MSKAAETKLPSTTLDEGRARNDDRPRFSALGLQVLSDRGIDEDTAHKAGLYTYWTEEEGAKLLRLTKGQHQVKAPGLAIPYPGQPDFVKLRPDDPRLRNPEYDRLHGTAADYTTMPMYIDGPKYLCPAGMGAPIYLPYGPGDPVLLNAEEIWIAESEFKALVLRMLGKAAVGLQGVQSGGNTVLRWWGKCEGQSIQKVAPGLERLGLRGKTVVICFDNDVDTNADVLAALHRFVVLLSAEGATVEIAYLPPGKKGEKVGVDDFLAQGDRDCRLEDLVASVRPLNVQEAVEWLEDRWDDWSQAQKDRELARVGKLARLLLPMELDFKKWARALKLSLGKITFEEIEVLAPKPDRARVPRAPTFSTLCQIVRDDAARAVACGRTGKLEMDVRTRELFIDRKPYGSDTDISACREALATRLRPSGFDGDFDFGKDMIIDALALVASESGFNPVQEYLSSLTWDGTPRISQLLEHVLRVSEPHRRELEPVLLRKWFIGAVARALDPGCKVDTVLIVVGTQGVKKSTFFGTLGGEWFSDSPVPIGDKDGMLLLGKMWIIEWPELDSMLRARNENSVKAFVSSRQDVFRPPYGRSAVTVKRSSVFVGTTNEDEFLTDATGNRRYWTISGCGKINIELLKAWRDQLWGEAVAAYRAGEEWWLLSEQEALLARVQSKHERTDPWFEIISSWLETTRTQRVRVAHVLERALVKHLSTITRSDQMRVVACLKTLGWKLDQKRDGMKKEKFYISPEYDPLAP